MYSAIDRSRIGSVRKLVKEHDMSRRKELFEQGSVQCGAPIAKLMFNRSCYREKGSPAVRTTPQINCV